MRRAAGYPLATHDPSTWCGSTGCLTTLTPAARRGETVRGRHWLAEDKGAVVGRGRLWSAADMERV